MSLIMTMGFLALVGASEPPESPEARSLDIAAKIGSYNADWQTSPARKSYSYSTTEYGPCHCEDPTVCMSGPRRCGTVCACLPQVLCTAGSGNSASASAKASLPPLSRYHIPRSTLILPRETEPFIGDGQHVASVTAAPSAFPVSLPIPRGSVALRPQPQFPQRPQPPPPPPIRPSSEDSLSLGQSQSLLQRLRAVQQRREAIVQAQEYYRQLEKQQQYYPQSSGSGFYTDNSNVQQPADSFSARAGSVSQIYSEQPLYQTQSQDLSGTPKINTPGYRLKRVGAFYSPLAGPQLPATPSRPSQGTSLWRPANFLVLPSPVHFPPPKLKYSSFFY